ncbi:MAG: rhodanese-like domain-containing protein [Peptostreptococcaceae bacterium]|nr:rhodanese-like domain-containing protein [Peptostreptococcaceae bacterium]
MKFKKILSVALCFAMITMSLAACGAKTEAPAETPPVAESTVVADATMSYFSNLPATNNMITAEDLFAKIDAGEEMFIIDVRSADDYALGHLKGAVNLPFASTAIAENLEFIPDDVPVFVNCYTGQTASQVTVVLNVAGKNVTNIRGGWLLGLSTTAGYENYADTVAVEMPTATYDTDPELTAAVNDYFATVVSYNGTPTANQNISPEAVKEIIDSESDEYQILSVRKAEDFALGHVATAINIPWGAGMETSFAELPSDKKIIVYCYTGHTASQTVAGLRLLGYEAYNMSFGMGSVETEKGWLGGGYETVTE